jgi:hypothetical protein
MKVNEIITEAGVWQGIKNVGRGIGQIAGGAATGVIRGLDQLAGGSGDVGTLKQREQRKLNQTTRNLANINRKLPQQALANFEVQLSEQSIDLNDPTTFNPTSVRNSLRDFGLQFFAGGEDDDTKAYIAQTAQYEPLPGKIDRKTVLNYFRELTKIRSNAVLWVAQNQSSQEIQQAQQTQQTQQARPTSAGGVTLTRSAGRDNAGQPTPTYITYQNIPFALMDDGRWVDVRRGKTVNTALASFLQTELESIS